MGLLEKLEEIQKEYDRTQKNKATEGHLGKLKAKMAKIKNELMEGPKGSSKPGEGFDVAKTGNASVAMIGFPSVGKSTLLSTLTDTKSESAAYEFTTLTCIPGIITYKDCTIQLLDLPGIIQGAGRDGRGRGREVIAVARGSDMVLMVLDASKADVQRRLLTKELEDVGIRLNQAPPNIYFKRKKIGGIKFNSVVEMTKSSEKAFREVLSFNRIHNAEVLVREDVTTDQFIDVVLGNRRYMRCLYAVNKIDTVSLDEVDRLARRPHTVVLAANWKLNLDGLLDSVWEHLDFVRVFTKKRGHRPDFSDPLIVPRGSTIEDVCRGVHRDFVARFKVAFVWGRSAKHQPQSVGLKHRLADEDVVQLLTK